MKYLECFEEGKRILSQAGVAEAALDARLLLEAACGTGRNDLLAHGDREVEEEKYRFYRSWIDRRADRVPLQHLTGVQEFMGLNFEVNEHVLIPRQDTEILVEEVLRELHDGMSLLDMCTGSGCILISLLYYTNRCRGLGTDLSPEALRTARRNAGRLLSAKGLYHPSQDCGPRPEEPSIDPERGLVADFLQSDLFDRVHGCFDVIVSNPPYIRTGEISGLMPEVCEHEPLSALDGHEDGLFFYRRIADESRQYLERGGRLYFEIGFDQAEAVRGIMREAGFLEIRTIKDYAGLDRVVSGLFIE